MGRVRVTEVRRAVRPDEEAGVPAQERVDARLQGTGEVARGADADVLDEVDVPPREVGDLELVDAVRVRHLVGAQGRRGDADADATEDDLRPRLGGLGGERRLQARREDRGTRREVDGRVGQHVEDLGRVVVRERDGLGRVRHLVRQSTAQRVLVVEAEADAQVAAVLVPDGKAVVPVDRACGLELRRGAHGGGTRRPRHPDRGQDRCGGERREGGASPARANGLESHDRPPVGRFPRRVLRLFEGPAKAPRVAAASRGIDTPERAGSQSLTPGDCCACRTSRPCRARRRRPLSHRPATGRRPSRSRAASRG